MPGIPTDLPGLTASFGGRELAGFLTLWPADLAIERARRWEAHDRGPGEGLVQPWHHAGGLLPVGDTVNADVVAVRVVGSNPRRWPVVVVDEDFHVDEVGGTISGFVLAWVNGDPVPESFAVNRPRPGRPLLGAEPASFTPAMNRHPAAVRLEKDVPGLDRLMALVKPPIPPADPPTEHAWASTIEDLQLPDVPGEMRSYLSIYGTCLLADQMLVWNPSARKRMWALSEQSRELLAVWKDDLAAGLQRIPPAPLYPDPGGLVPVAATVETVIWLSVPSWPGEMVWPALTCSPLGWREHNMGLVDLLVAWIEGRGQFGPPPGARVAMPLV